MRKEEQELKRAIESRLKLGYALEDAKKLAVRFIKRRKKEWAKKKVNPLI